MSSFFLEPHSDILLLVGAAQRCPPPLCRMETSSSRQGLAPHGHGADSVEQQRPFRSNNSHGVTLSMLVMGASSTSPAGSTVGGEVAR